MPDSFPLFPRAASTLADNVDLLFWVWVVISAFFSLLIAGLIFYFFFRYERRHPDEVGQPERPATSLEIIWSVIPLVIALAMFGWGTKVFFDLSRPPADAVEYFATGKQWMWKIQHPTGEREINELHIPVGRPIKLTMISEDVIHSFYVPAFRTKADVLPGRYTTVWFEATEPGEYHLFCAEYCGTEHSLMGGTIYAMEPAAYEEWLEGPGAAATAVDAGAELFTALACDTCHQAGERSRGPALEGLFGSQVRLASGETVIADEAYIRESILQPQAKMVAGYMPLMPTFQGQVTEEQLLDLLAYIKGLGADGEAAEAAGEGVTPGRLATPRTLAAPSADVSAIEAGEDIQAEDVIDGEVGPGEGDGR